MTHILWVESHHRTHLLQVLISRVEQSSPGIRSGFVATLETSLPDFEQVTYIHEKQFPQL